jgi:hypothetical protein
LLGDAIELAIRIIDSGFRPDLIVGIWRGGTPVGIAVQEVMEYVGINSDHIAIRTDSYSSIGERSRVKVHGLEYLERHLATGDKLLLVDDVFDTGLSIDGVLLEMNSIYKDGLPEYRVATPYFKPANNKTARKPDFYLYETADWLVFPHELIGLSDREIIDNKPLSNHLKERLLFLHRRLAKSRV